ncbi:MAG: hypothetical protein ACKOW9_02685 [Candidatus Paceibacterota bacterium]
MNTRGKKIETLLQYIRTNTDTAERELIIDRMKNRQTNKAKLLLSILFPEYVQPCRLPDRFGQLTSVFRSYRFLDVVPNSGFISIAFTPRCLTADANFPILQVRYNLSGANVVAASGDNFMQSENVFDYFDSAVLRAAVIRVYYIGSQEYQKGYFCGGIDYSFDVQTAANTGASGTVYSLNAIENGFNKRFSGPEEGVRFAYLPRGNNELAFEELATNVTTSRNQQAILIYGRNLAPDCSIRIDIIRHIEGLPKESVRPYMSVKRPEPGEPDDVYEVISELTTSVSDMVNFSQAEARSMYGEFREHFNTMYSDEVPPVYSKYGDVIPL